MSKQHVHPGQPISIPSKEAVVDHQLSVLISGVAALYNLLCVGRANDKENPTSGPADGGTDWAIQTTIINMMNRLDNVIKNEALWDTSGSLALHEGAKALMKQQSEFLAKQDEVAREAVLTQQITRLPHIMHQPTLTRIEGGLFAAILGKVGNRASVYGIGRTPAEAFANFDEVFCGRMPEFMRQWAAQQEQQQLENEKSKLDSGRSGVTPPAKRSQMHPPGNRRPAKSKPGVGGAETGPPPKGKLILPEDDPDAFRERGGA
jgi:hypothetical protein